MRAFFGVLFVGVTGFAVLQGFGYEYTLKYGFTKTSIIDVRANLGKADLFLDGELVTGILPFEIHKVPLGNHEMRISKAGYETKKFEVRVEEGIVTKLDNIVLLPLERKIINFSEKILAYFKDKPVFLQHSADENIYSIIGFSGFEFEKIRSFVFESAADFRFFDGDILSWYKDGYFYLLKPNFLMPLSLPYTGRPLVDWQYLPGADRFFLNDGEKLSLGDIKKEGLVLSSLASYFRQYWLRGEILVIRAAGKIVIFNLRTGNELRSWNFSYDQDILEAMFFDDQVLVWTGSGALNLFADDSVTVIDQGVQSVTDISPEGNLLILKESGEISSYNIFSGKRKFINRYGSSELRLSWYRNSNNFWLFSKTSARICSVVTGFCDLSFDLLDDYPLYYAEENLFLLKREGEYFLYPVDDGEENKAWWRWN